MKIQIRFSTLVMLCLGALLLGSGAMFVGWKVGEFYYPVPTATNTPTPFIDLATLTPTKPAPVAAPTEPMQAEQAHSCSVSAAEFMQVAQPGTEAYVVTLEKLGMAGDQYLWVDVLFGPENAPEIIGYLGSRGYEFGYNGDRIGNNSPQEIHTTINAFDLDLPFHEPYIIVGEDDAMTDMIVFQIGQFEGNIKTKHTNHDVAAGLLWAALDVVMDGLECR